MSKNKIETVIKLPSQHKHKRFHAIHDDPMACVRRLSKKSDQKLVLRDMEGWKRNRFNTDFLHRPYLIHYALHYDGRSNYFSGTCLERNVTLDTLDCCYVCTYLLVFDQFLC